MSTALVLASTNVVASMVGWFVGFVVWIIIMVWVHHLAKRKGRHAFLWLVLAFFFSFFALIVILLLPSNRTTDRIANR